MSSKEYCLSFDPGKCVLCYACVTACKIHNNVERGCSWRQVKTLWYGTYPEVKSVNLSSSCMHCIDPECMKACPEEAIGKDSNGIVNVDQDLCSGCRLCFDACPVKAPQYDSNGKMQKCNFCLHRINRGEEPVCAATCPSGAIEFKLVDISDKIKFEKEMTGYFSSSHRSS